MHDSVQSLRMDSERENITEVFFHLAKSETSKTLDENLTLIYIELHMYICTSNLISDRVMSWWKELPTSAIGMVEQLNFSLNIWKGNHFMGI